MTASWQLVLLLGRARRARHRVDGAGASSRPSPAAGSSRTAAWSPGCSPRAARPASWSSCRWSPGWPQTHGWRIAALGVAGGRARRRAARGVVCCATTRPTSALPPYGGHRRTTPPAARGRRRPARAAARCATPPAPGRSGCSPAGSRSAARRTNGLIGTHFIPAAHDHGMPTPTAAGLLALVGMFDIVGHDLLRLAHRPGRLARCCSAPTTRCAGCRCWCCRCCSPPRPPEHAACSSCSTAWTGWRPCRRRSRCAAQHFGADGAGRVRLGVRLAPGRRGHRGRSARGSSATGCGTYDAGLVRRPARLCLVAARAVAGGGPGAQAGGGGRPGGCSRVTLLRLKCRNVTLLRCPGPARRPG